MNTVELSNTLNKDVKWTRFADRLLKAMVDEYQLDGVTVLVRELTTEERGGEEPVVLAFNHDQQRFEFAVSAEDRCPTAWKVADRIDHFLNP
jgi:hypothetical protein